MSNGVGLPQDDLVKADNFDMNQYYPAVVQAAKIFENKLMGLPFKLQPQSIGVYYNATAFNEEKVTPPTLDTSQEQFVEIAKKMTKMDASGKPSRFGFLPIQIGTANGGYESLIVTTPAVRRGRHRQGRQESHPQHARGHRRHQVDLRPRVHGQGVAERPATGGGDPANPQDAMFVAGTGAMYQAGLSAKSLPTRVKGNSSKSRTR